MTVNKRRLLARRIGRTLALLRVARGKERRELAAAVGLPLGDLQAIEEGTGEASPLIVVDLLVALHFGVEDLMLVLVATAYQRRPSRSALALALEECLALRRGNRDRPLSELLGVGGVEGLREGLTWSVARLLGRFWREVESGGSIPT